MPANERVKESDKGKNCGVKIFVVYTIFNWTKDMCASANVKCMQNYMIFMATRANDQVSDQFRIVNGLMSF